MENKIFRNKIFEKEICEYCKFKESCKKDIYNIKKQNDIKIISCISYEKNIIGE